MTEQSEQYQRILEEGTHAKALLEHPGWQFITNELRETWKDAIVKAPPENKDQREFFYYLNLALDHIEGVLDQRQQQAAQIAEILELDEMEKAEEQPQPETEE